MLPKKIVSLLSGAAVCLPSIAAAGDFAQCKTHWQDLALERGLEIELVLQVVPALEHLPKVIELDRRQPEFTSSFADYLGRRVTEKRIETGKEMLSKHAGLLDKLTKQYGVPGRFLVAFWGLETNFGNYLGNMPTLDALATLACDERRSRYFTGELMTALELVEKHQLDPSFMRGSWAGAMGHTQFMPDNYKRFAIDGDGDGKINLWTSIPDALTSAANFLNKLGWTPETRWGREVLLPAEFDYSLTGRKQSRSLQAWAELGIRNANGAALPIADIEASLVVPAGHQGPAFLAYPNFRTIMRWNNSEFYALSVGLLADRIIGAGELKRPPPSDLGKISLASIQQLQARLNAMGFDAGKPDGIPGPGTRGAIQAFQASKGMIADGYHSAQVFAALGINPSKASQ